MLQSDLPESGGWSPLGEGVGVALWTSFIVACLETMIIFAFLDPATLGFEGLAPPLVALRPMLYGIGFFLLWSFAFIAAALTAYMLESGPHARSWREGTAHTRSSAGTATSQPTAES